MSLDGLNIRYNHLSIFLDDHKTNLVAHFHLVEQGLVPGGEDHAHRRHVQVFDRTVLDCELARFFVDLANLAIA